MSQKQDFANLPKDIQDLVSCILEKVCNTYVQCTAVNTTVGNCNSAAFCVCKAYTEVTNSVNDIKVIFSNGQNDSTSIPTHHAVFVIKDGYSIIFDITLFGVFILNNNDNEYLFLSYKETNIKVNSITTDKIEVLLGKNTILNYYPNDKRTLFGTKYPQTIEKPKSLENIEFRTFSYNKPAFKMSMKKVKYSHKTNILKTSMLDDVLLGVKKAYLGLKEANNKVGSDYTTDIEKLEEVHMSLSQYPYSNLLLGKPVSDILSAIENGGSFCFENILNE